MKRKADSLRVLIVDDNEAYRVGLSEYVDRQKGLSVVGEAGGGDQAVYLARRLNPDIVLMDISMPGVNGIEAAKDIKEYLPDTKVVFVTVHKEETYRAIGEMIGADGFVTKNFVKEGLKEVIKNIRSQKPGKSRVTVN
ncbi:MAG: response regulator transcription factor [Ignavibacteriales bacterium]|nr:response regulator transcription factor [Ignavibacteriales bacterium]